MQLPTTTSFIVSKYINKMYICEFKKTDGLVFTRIIVESNYYVRNSLSSKIEE